MVVVWRKCGICFKESLQESVTHQILRKNPDPEYYNKEVKQHKAKVITAYNKGKLDERYQVEMKRVSKELLAARKTAQETFLQSVL
jgi:hypothetical protein